MMTDWLWVFVSFYALVTVCTIVSLVLWIDNGKARALGFNFAFWFTIFAGMTIVSTIFGRTL